MEPYEDWIAPWEKPGAGEFNAESARKYVYDVQAEREQAQTAEATAKAKIDELETKIVTATARITTLEGEGGDVTQLKQTITQLQGELDTTRENNRKSMLASVKAEFKLTDKQAAKLTGDDLEALRLDAKDTFGEPPAEESGDGGDQTGKPASDPRLAPTGRLRNSGDPTPDERKIPTVEEAMARIPV